MRNSHIAVAPIAGALGAEIGGVDVAQDLDAAVIGEIRQALLDHGVIFFRDQKLDRERHKAFTRRFGEIFIHPNYNGVSADPEIVDIRREPGDKKIVGEDWHTDTTMVAEPPMGAILYADRSAALWRGYLVRQPVSRLRKPVATACSARSKACAPCTPTEWLPVRRPE